MNNYLDLLDIDTDIQIKIKLSVIGSPEFSVIVADNQWNNQHDIIVNHKLLSPLNIEVELKNKHYTTEYETAVIIDSISVDNISIIPLYCHLANYQNDHNNNNPTNYVGFNGKWTLTINRPFYHWLHQVQGQGWLLS
jgi:hypothetical protein